MYVMINIAVYCDPSSLAYFLCEFGFLLCSFFLFVF